MQIRDTVESEWQGPKPEALDRNLGSVEDFVSLQFHTVFISFCKTQNCEEEGGALLNSQAMIDFIFARCTHKLVLFAKGEVLTEPYRIAFAEGATETLDL